MKTQKKIYAILFSFILFLHASISTPYVSAPNPAPLPDQIIGEIFPNCTLPLQLSHTSTLITINTTKSLRKASISFNANYTISNHGNTNTVTVILPFSLALNITEFTVQILTNQTQIPYDLFDIPTWKTNFAKVDIYFLPRSVNIYPLTFIKSNITFLRNSTLIIRYQFKSLLENPLDSRDFFFLMYYLGTSQKWIGNTTGRVELQVYGKQPIFSTAYYKVDQIPNVSGPYVIEFNGGKTFAYEWDNINIFRMSVGMRFYRELTTLEKFIDIMALDNSYTWVIFIIIAVFIVGIVFIIKYQKKRKNI
ncbi:MAG: hypothetical protein ACFFB0_00370 [Promethearchaeota archaeon]